MLLGCSLSFSVGELNFDLFLTSSNNLTATVECNAAREKKNLPFSRLLYQTGRCSPQLEVDSCGKLTWRPLFLMMEYEESVSVRLTLNLILTIWNRVLIPCPWKSMKDLWDLGRMKYGSPQRLQSHHLPLGSFLPGDGQGRECFDLLPRFVVGDPSTRFETHTPLTYKTNGETEQPLWAEIFRHILKECAYLTAFHTVYVMVDTCNLKAHETAQDGLSH